MDIVYGTTDIACTILMGILSIVLPRSTMITLLFIAIAITLAAWFMGPHKK